MALVIELGSKGFPTSFGRLLQSMQTPFRSRDKMLSPVDPEVLPASSRAQ